MNPGRSANRSTSLSWTPTFYLVADYTDYLQDPPWNGVQDISHVFLSLDVDRGVRTNQYYTVESWDSSSSNWQFVESGSTTSGSLSAPSSGWDASENETTHFSYTDYRITARNASTTGTIVSQSQFRAINMAPVACFDAKGVDNLVATFMFRLHLILNAVQIPIACTLLRALRKTLHRQHGISMEFLIPQVDLLVFLHKLIQSTFHSKWKMIKVLFDGKIKPFPLLISLSPILQQYQTFRVKAQFDLTQIIQ